ncbi:MAG: hypothetical protein JNK05_33545 [Myxococcales bacterium]|nr:hypothetical protein [Myxococcales bacterium]
MALLGFSAAGCALPHAQLRGGAAGDGSAADSVEDIADDATRIDVPEIDSTAPDVPVEPPGDVPDVTDARADTGIDTGVDSGVDTGVDSGVDTGVDSRVDTGVDTGVDAGCPSGTFDCGDGRCRTVVATVDTCRSATSDGVHVLTVGGTPWCSYCRDNSDGPRWTLVLRVNGSDEGGRDPQRFQYSSEYWRDTRVYQPWALDIADDRECKLRGFFAQSFTDIRIVVTGTDRMTGLTSVRSMGRTVSSLRDVFAGGDNQFNNLWTADAFLSLAPAARVQRRNMRVGFNVTSGSEDFARVRIGVVGDESDPFGTPDSYFGLGGSLRGSTDYSAGNVATFNDPSNRDTPYYALVYVR